MRNARAALGLGMVALTGAGCGNSGSFANEPRPPTPINISAAISPDRITVSPTTFGAGPVVMIIANETDRAHRVTVRSEPRGASGAGLEQSTAPINPKGTATLKIDMRQGSYVVTVEAGDVRETRVEVGKPRPSSKDDVMQP